MALLVFLVYTLHHITPRDVAVELPEVVAKIKSFGDKIRAELGDTLTGRVGTGNRLIGVVN